MIIGNTYKTTGQDWANHLSHETSGNGMLCLVAILGEKPDAGILQLAVADLIDAQPILGCLFDETLDPPSWVPTETDNRFEERTVTDLRDGLIEFLREPASPNPMVAVRLISCCDQFAVCLLLDHSVADGGGIKGCLMLLTEFYNARLTGGIPSPTRIPSDRSEEQLFERCGIRDFRTALKKRNPAPERPLTVPYSAMEGHKLQYEWISLPISALRYTGYTVNDQLLAATARALGTVADNTGHQEMATVQFTADLRRCFGADAAPIVCNMSGIESVSVSPQKPFHQVLSDVRPQTAAMKANVPGLSSAAAMALLRRMPYDKAKEILLDGERKCRLSGCSAPLLSNLGKICREPISFGSTPVTAILPLLPAFHAPVFMLGAGGYADALTLSAGFYSDERNELGVRRFLQSIRNELMDPSERNWTRW